MDTTEPIPDAVNLEKIEKEYTIETLYQTIHSAANFENIAEHIVKDLGVYYDLNQLWWLWNKNESKWELADEVTIMNTIDEALQFDRSTLDSKMKGIILEGLKRKGRKFPPIPLLESQIQFKGKIINVENNSIIDSSKSFFAVNPINWELSNQTETPAIDKLFIDWVGEKNKDLLYEILAFCLANKYFVHRIICFTGSGSNGKSCFLELLTKFLGKDNICSTELETLISNRFESSKMFKKLGCFMGETNFATMKNTSLLKRLCGGDLINFEFKNKNPFDDYNYAKIIIATNTLPETLDKTDGFYRRWLIIDFNNKFKENGDIIGTVPVNEFNNLATKCVSILQALIKRNTFVNEGDIESRKHSYESHSNPFSLFIKMSYCKDVNKEEPYFEVYDNYISFLNIRGLRNLTKREFTKILEENGFDIVKKHVQKQDGTETTWNYIVGITKIIQKQDEIQVNTCEIVQETTKKDETDTDDTDDIEVLLTPLIREVSKNTISSRSSISEMNHNPLNDFHLIDGYPAGKCFKCQKYDFHIVAVNKSTKQYLCGLCYESLEKNE